MHKEKLLIVTEAALENPSASPLSDVDQARINGVYRTYENLLPHLRGNYNVEFLTPFDYDGPERPLLRGVFNLNTPFAAPKQNSIRLVVPSRYDIERRMSRIAPDYIHIATEGPLGIAAMRYARRHNLPVSTAFHTNWQQYVMEDGFHVPLMPKALMGSVTKSLLMKFHRSAITTMAATSELKDELSGWGMDPSRIHIVSRGIDTDIFRLYPDNERAIAEDYVLYVGRLAPGKGVERFCELDTKGLMKVVVGTGPLAEKLKAQYPDILFTGFAQGETLARYYNSAKFFVLPSDTETFGMTVIESLACGTPVVALNKGGHQPILNAAEGLGVMNGDLQTAMNLAFEDPDQFLTKREMADYIAGTRSWAHEAEHFSDMLKSAGALTIGF